MLVLVRAVYRPPRFLGGGDHPSFLKQGFPAVRFTEPHEDFKQIEFIDFDFTARVAKVNGACLMVARTSAWDTKGRRDGSTLTNNSTLKWAADLNADAGYEVVWRETDKPGARMIPVGEANTVTVDLSKDNVHMGIRAVGKNGSRNLTRRQ